MKLTVHKYTFSTQLSLPSSFIKIKSNQEFKINGIPFKAKISFRNKLSTEGSISKSGIITIPKKVAAKLKLKNKQRVNIE